MPWASLVFDVDSALVDCETLELVSEEALTTRAGERDAVMHEVRRITALGMEGTIPFAESLARRLQLIAPTRTHVQTVAATIPSHITRSFLAHTDFFSAHRDRIFVVSNGFKEIIFPATDLLGIRREHVYASEFTYDDAGRVIGVVPGGVLLEASGKAKTVALMNPPHPCIMVGDGWTDYEVKEYGAADVFVAYTEHARRERVVAHADASVSSLDELLELLERAGNAQ